MADRLTPRTTALLVAAIGAAAAIAAVRPGLAQSPPSLSSQTQEQADAKSVGCVSCHTTTDQKTMHVSTSVRLGCTDCHGGDAAVRASGGPGSGEYRQAQERAHVQPANRDLWRTSANPERAYTALLDEDLAFVKFINPGDLRAAPQACGPCHAAEVKAVSKSLMTHGSFLYEAATYNNGVLPGKDAIIGESYGPDGKPRILKTVPPPTADEMLKKGVVAALVPLVRWELGMPGNPYRRLRARRPPAAGGRRVRRLRRAGQAGPGVLAARLRHQHPHRSGDPGRAEDAPARPAALDAGHERPSG